jgi:hypoxanthine phosphoribosyltransferase
MWRPERVVCVAGGGAMAGVSLAKGLKMVSHSRPRSTHRLA